MSIENNPEISETGDPVEVGQNYIDRLFAETELFRNSAIISGVGFLLASLEIASPMPVGSTVVGVEMAAKLLCDGRQHERYDIGSKQI